MSRNNRVLNLIEEHRSVRSFDKDHQLRNEELRTIIKAAQRSSTSYNLQTYHFVSVTDKKKRREIALLASQQWFICDASVFLVVCVDLNKMSVVTSLAGYEYLQSKYLESFTMAVIDASLACQNAALAAESMGYGICMIGGIRNNPKRICQILSLPDKVLPIVGLCIGRSLKINEKKTRMPTKGVLSINHYDNKAVVNAIREYDKEMAKNVVYKNREFPIDGIIRVNERDSQIKTYGWIEHSARRVSTPNPEKMRSGLRKTITDQAIGLE